MAGHHPLGGTEMRSLWKTIHVLALAATALLASSFASAQGHNNGHGGRHVAGGVLALGVAAAVVSSQHHRGYGNHASYGGRGGYAQGPSDGGYGQSYGGYAPSYGDQYYDDYGDYQLYAGGNYDSYSGHGGYGNSFGGHGGYGNHSGGHAGYGSSDGGHGGYGRSFGSHGGRGRHGGGHHR